MKMPVIRRSNSTNKDPLEICGVIGDVLEPFRRSVSMTVTFNNSIEINNGCELKPSQVVNKPSIGRDDDLRALYTLIMTDPNAPSPSNPSSREYLHWLVRNIPSRRGDGDGEEIVSYERPKPTAGIHRMVLVLFRQQQQGMRLEPPGWRQNFSTRDFSEIYNLGSPVAAAYFNYQREAGNGGRSSYRTR